MGHTSDISNTGKRDLSFVIINYNTAEITGNCIRSLLGNQSLRNLSSEIIVVDNASVDGSEQILTSEFGSLIQFIPSGENLGFGRANNLGVSNASGRFLVLINSDCLAGSTDFIPIRDILESEAPIGFLSVRVLNEDLTIQTVGSKFPDLLVDFKTHVLFHDLNLFKKIRYRNYAGQGLFQVDWVSGCFMAVKKVVFDELQGFDPKIFMYAEDIDICFRACKRGYSNYVYDKTSLIHLHGKSGNSKPSLAKMLNTVPNYFYIVRKHQLSRFIFLMKCFTYFNVLAIWIFKNFKARIR
jgi:GT2 family glycosyltransferase